MESLDCLRSVIYDPFMAYRMKEKLKFPFIDNGRKIVIENISKEKWVHFLWGTLYRVSHKKRNGGFSVHCERKVVNIFTSPYKVFSAEENDT